MDAFTHRVRNLCACRIEGIVYVEPHYRSIIYTQVSVKSRVVERNLTLAWVLSHIGGGMVVGGSQSSDRDLGVIFGKSRAVADTIESPHPRPYPTSRPPTPTQ
jgi:hypothetical protein